MYIIQNEVLHTFRKKCNARESNQFLSKVAILGWSIARTITLDFNVNYAAGFTVRVRKRHPVVDTLGH